MSLSSEILSDLPVFTNTDEFGEEITFAGETVNATLVADDLTPNLGLNSNQGLLFVAASDLSSVPEYRDIVVISGVTWYAFQDESDRVYYEANGMYIINITNSERPELL